MFGKRCSLCGGKLDSQMVCRECGLDNSKSEKYYRINQSSCDGQPLTHVHKDREPSWDKQPNTGGKAGRKVLGIVAGIAVVLIIASILIPIGMESFWEWDAQNGAEDFGEIAYDPYEYLDEELPAEGEIVEFSLPSGRYVAGVHIPAGTYAAQPEDEFDVISVEDRERGIYLYEYEANGAEESFLDDLRIFPGAVVTIETKTAMNISSQNAQTADVGGQANPLTEEVTLGEGETLTAGMDFEPGVYNVWLASGNAESATVFIEIIDETGEVCRQDYLQLGTTEYDDGEVFCNFVFPEKSRITCQSEGSILLTPSAAVDSLDYEAAYGL